ncbi:hypothetical protein [Actinoplanes sp. DH11]|uniref:hypothetical protein n=1 Tax=Actinoplanes sp. DH11 TaxID=2857011 RepID=UPI001E47C521|nr:hypothetical protein [Actinoplanes sp. DH11]
MLIGATFKKSEISHWQPRLTKNEIFRIFPNADGLPPAWTDPRYQYCKEVGAIPFISSKVDGDPGKLGELRELLAGMPSWVKVLYLTDRHEPEDDTTADGTKLTPQGYQDNFNAVLTMVRTELPPPVRSRVRCGPVLTKQWTENHPDRTYRTWDPGTGDFFGVDAYVNSWSAEDGSTVFTRYPDAGTWLQKVKTYRFNGSDARPRILPELGAIQPHWDRDGAARAAFMQDVHTELSSWNPNTTGWAFQGWIWWNTEGTSGRDIRTVGKHRWFQLDHRHNGKPLIQRGRVVDPQGGYEVLSSEALRMFNTLALLDRRTESLEISPADWPHITLPVAGVPVAPVVQP